MTAISTTSSLSPDSVTTVLSHFELPNTNLPHGTPNAEPQHATALNYEVRPTLGANGLSLAWIKSEFSGKFFHFTSRVIELMENKLSRQVDRTEGPWKLKWSKVWWPDSAQEHLISCQFHARRIISELVSQRSTKKWLAHFRPEVPPKLFVWWSSQLTGKT